MTTKRLFLVAAYDPMGIGIVDASLMQLVRGLGKYGDVVIFMDNDAPGGELKKLAPHVRHADAMRHGEYDFGSYKRAYIWAQDHMTLGDIDVVYMVNDSVYGPLGDIGELLQKMENLDADAIGPVYKVHKIKPHLESWFMGFRPSIFMSPWFDTFMTSITKLESKGAVIAQYENGLARLIRDQGLTADGVYHVHGRETYNRVAGLYRQGLPFIKKMSWRRRHGALGGQIAYVLRHMDNHGRDAIMENANRIYGPDFNKWFITRNPIKIAWRNIKHFFHKVFIEGI